MQENPAPVHGWCAAGRVRERKRERERERKRERKRGRERKRDGGGREREREGESLKITGCPPYYPTILELSSCTEVVTPIAPQVKPKSNNLHVLLLGWCPTAVSRAFMFDDPTYTL
jgi:hypothetical protein